jgi:hypothetical protein
MASTLAVNPYRSEVLRWYRKLLQSAFLVEWKTDDDAEYVLNETRRLFRRNQHLRDLDTIARKLEEAETRYGLGVHYKIPYPRMFHHAQGAVTGSGVAYATYLDSHYDGEEANPKFNMSPGGHNSPPATATAGTGKGYLEFDGADDGFDMSRR